MKNLINKTLVILAVFILAMTTQEAESQRVITKKGGYEVENTFYAKDGLREVIKDVPYAMDYLRKAESQKSFGSGALKMGGITTAAGMFMIYNGHRIHNSSSSDGLSKAINGGLFKLSGAAIVVVGVSVLTVSVISYSNANSNYKRAIKEYHISDLRVKDVSKNDIIIETKVSNTGVGLAYHF